MAGFGEIDSIENFRGIIEFVSLPKTNLRN